MIRHRAWILLAALVGGALFLLTWRMAEIAPGVRPAGEGLAVPLDDAAIYFQYAKQALHGAWLSYNPGAPLSTGVTSPLYLLLLTGALGLGLNGPWAAWLLGLAALLLGTVAAERLGRRLFPLLPAWWMPALLLCQGYWVALHFNAMETGLFLGLSLALLDALTDPNAVERAWLLLGLLAFTRPEGQVLAVLLGIPWLWSRACERRTLALLALAAAPSLLLLALSGSMVPDSVRPKSAFLQGGKGLLELASQASLYAMGVVKGAWMGFWGGADEVGVAGSGAAGNPVGPLFPPLALLGALFGAYSLRGQAGRRWLADGLLLGLGAMLLLLAWDLPVGWHNHRYLSAATPLLFVALVAGLDALRQQARFGRPLSAALFTLWAGYGLLSWPWHLQRTYTGARDYALVNRNAALALRGLPPGPVAVVDSGLLACYGGHPIVDLLGITDHQLALAQAQGKGAVLEALLNRPQPPLWAALHPQRPDFDLATWRALGLLQLRGQLADDMQLFAWNWSGADRRDQPVTVPAGHRVLGMLDVADLGSEAAHHCRFSGLDAGRTLIARLRVWKGGPEVPEGGRKIATVTLSPPPGTKALLVRAALDRDGSLYIGNGHAWNGVEERATPSEQYSETLLPLPAPSAGPVTVIYAGGPHFQDVDQRDWALYRVWFLD